MRLPRRLSVAVSSFALTGLVACSSSNDASGGRDAGALDSGAPGAGGRSGAGGNAGSSGGKSAGGTSQAGAAGANGSGGAASTGGTTNAGTGGTIVDSLDSGDGRPDATSTMDAAGSTDARASSGSGDAADAAPVRCASSCLFNACDGSACAVTKLATTGGGVWDVAVVGSQIFWTEGFDLRVCTAPPCATGTVLASVGGSTYFGLVTAKSSAVDYLYVTDDNFTHGLLRVGLSGTPNDSWGAAPDHASAVATNGDVVIYGDEYGTYRVTVGTQGSTKVMDTAPAFFAAPTVQPGPPLHNVAVDATTMFAASPTDVYKCPVAGNCAAAALVAAGAQPMPKVVALAVHGGTLYALGGTPFVVGGTEQIWSVSTAGGNVSNVASVSPIGNGQGTPFGLLADDAHLYWGSLDGNLYTCGVGSACVPTVLVKGARPMGMTQDQNAVYWGASSGSAIYRVVKPH